jgi:xylulokinase
MAEPLVRRGSVVIGIDLGTSEAKAIAIGPDGRLAGLGRAGYPTLLGADGRAEQEPAAWWAAVSAAVRALGVAADDVLAVCGVAQGPTLVAVDAAGDALRPAITWQDRRVRAAGFGFLPSMSWLAREEPETVRRAAWLLPACDALGLWLTGVAATSTQTHDAGPDAASLAAAGVSSALVPAGRPFGSPLGLLRPEAAAALGLRTGTPVVTGVNDGAASMLGAGLRHAGDAVDTGGTSGGLAIYTDHRVSVPGLYVAPAPLPGMWAVGGAMAALGASLDWLRGSVLGDRWTLDELFAEAAAVPAGAGGVTFLPYLAGERAPVFDESARGAFVGLGLEHGRGHLVRAVLEGAAYAMRSVAEPLAAAGAPVRELRLAGRPTPGDLWARIKADVLGVPVAIPVVGETAVLGAAILAAAGSGAAADLDAAVAAMTAVARRVVPDPAARAPYDAGYPVYLALYPALRGG